MSEVDRGAQLYQVLRYVRPLTLDSARVVEAAMRRRRLTVGMRAVMEVLDQRGPSTVPDIARALMLARQGVQRLVNELLERDYVRVTANPAHLRSVLVTLTNRGSKAFDAIRAEELAQLSTMASGCTSAEIRTAVKVLSALAGDVRQRAGGVEPDEEESP
jgi:DNA-binding MarR family transcriptional regulator